MKHIVESVDEIYQRLEPWGEPILDAVVEALRKTRILFTTDMAVFLDADQRDLSGAVHLLTGLSLGEIIEGWRLRQAREMLEAEGFDFSKAEFMKQLPVETLRKVARRCGWSDERTMQNFLRRHRVITTRK